jgi:hypothetical protein
VNPLFSWAARAPGGGIRHPAIAAILRGAEEPRTNEIIEHRLADRAILSSETFDLRWCESHARHLEELRPNPFEDLFVGKFVHGSLSEIHRWWRTLRATLGIGVALALQGVGTSVSSASNRSGSDGLLAQHQ